MEYNFTLKYQLPPDDSDQEELVERLGAAGCDDALVGIGQPGRLGLEFTREAMTAQAAMVSALSDVKRLIPGGRLIEAAPDFVGLTDVAEMLGMSRQNMRKLMSGHPGSFPPPIHDGAAGLWHLADVLGWLQNKGHYQIDASVMEMARITRQVNAARAVRYLTPQLQRQVGDLVA